MNQQSKLVIVKPYNFKGQLDLMTENLKMDDFYVKKQVYDLIFNDVDLYFQLHNNDKRRLYKLKDTTKVVRTYEIQVDENIIQIQIDYSIL
jgi:hypothetical protein